MSKAPVKYSQNHKVPRFSEANGFYTTPERSQLMRKIKSKNTKPELTLRKLLWSSGVRYRINSKTLPGTPDISVKKYKLAVFVDGEFWHGYNWETKKHEIKSNRDFWIPKIERNMQKDSEVNAQLKQMGYTVFRFWGKELKQNPGYCLMQVLEYIDHFTKYR